MQTLKLNLNTVGPSGARALAKLVRGSECSLTSLELSKCDLCDSGRDTLGLEELAEALGVNAVLTSLDVGFNYLIEEAALGIVRVERQRNKLTSLGLGRCSIGPTGAAEIAEYVSGSGVLTTLDLRGNDLGDEGKGVIRDAVSGREGFKLKM